MLFKAITGRFYPRKAGFRLTKKQRDEGTEIKEKQRGRMGVLQGRKRTYPVQQHLHTLR